MPPDGGSDEGDTTDERIGDEFPLFESREAEARDAEARDGEIFRIKECVFFIQKSL